MVPKLYIARTADGSDFPLPSYASQYHVGLTLRAAIGNPIKISAGERIRVPVGFAIGVPVGFCGQVVCYVPLAERHGIIVSDAPHILNPADRKPLFVLLQNTSPNPYVLHRGDIIGELLIMPVVQVCWQEIQPPAIQNMTQETDLILDEGISPVPDQEEPAQLFASTRRVKKSIRNRFKSPDEESK